MGRRVAYRRDECPSIPRQLNRRLNPPQNLINLGIHEAVATDYILYVIRLTTQQCANLYNSFIRAKTLQRIIFAKQIIAKRRFIGVTNSQRFNLKLFTLFFLLIGYN